MRVIGRDLHTRWQTVAEVNTEMGEEIVRALDHSGDQVRRF